MIQLDHIYGSAIENKTSLYTFTLKRSCSVKEMKWGALLAAAGWLYLY